MALWRCEICGDPYVGDKAPANCPFCGAKKKFIKEAKLAEVNFDVELNEKDKAYFGIKPSNLIPEES